MHVLQLTFKLTFLLYIFVAPEIFQVDGDPELILTNFIPSTAKGKFD